MIDIRKLPVEYQQTLSSEQLLFDSDMGKTNRNLFLRLIVWSICYQYQKNG